MPTKYSYELHTDKIERLCKELIQCTDEGDFVGTDAVLIGIEGQIYNIRKKLHVHRNEGNIRAYQIREPDDGLENKKGNH